MARASQAGVTEPTGAQAFSGIDLEQLRSRCKAGPDALQRWLSRATAPRRVMLDISTEERADEVLRFRSQVGQLDSRCSSSSDAEAVNLVAELSTSKRQRLSSCRPVAIADVGDVGAARLFVARSTTERLIRKRCERKSSWRLPTASFRATAGHPNYIWASKAVIDLFLAFADVDDETASVGTCHLCKGGGRDATSVRSRCSRGPGWPLGACWVPLGGSLLGASWVLP